MAFVCATYARAGAGDVVLCALVVTLGTFCAMSVYVHLSQTEVSCLTAAVAVGMVSFVLLAMVTIVIPSLLLHAVLSAIGVAVFTGLVVYDTSNMVHRLSVDDAVDAVVQLYLDVLNLFLCFLQLFQACDECST